MRACKRCRHAIPDRDAEGVEFYVCALFPPHPQFGRPGMKPLGWCGQFKLSLRRLLFGHGA